MLYRCAQRAPGRQEGKVSILILKSDNGQTVPPFLETGLLARKSADDLRSELKWTSTAVLCMSDDEQLQYAFCFPADRSCLGRTC